MGTTINPYLYTSQHYDSPSGLYSLRARYYDPQYGRFISRDTLESLPADPNSVHKYLYAEDNPVNAIDPTGHQAFAEYSVQNEQSQAEAEATAARAGRFAESAADDAVRQINRSIRNPTNPTGRSFASETPTS